ncbi:MAG TPA: HAD-IA family hydrolase [Actinophytocola sp.]|jgi:sugar-phosphatase|uniref:HAD-IA family hydrolase n=1 Tax=Actinophytocola sp. TaxID=1872138 RepID=UPI002E06E069|nr:HAD-IA family hydrolase [Actinophytocola sp.]
MLAIDLPAGSGRRPLLCEAVLFDMDGTLVDSRACVEHVWRSWCARHRLDSERLLKVSHGRQNHDTIRIVAPHLDTTEEIATLVHAEESCRDGIVAVPGARRLLDRLPAARWAVVTSAWQRLAEIRLDRAGLPRPPTLVTADQTRRGKPDPEGYLLAAASLGARPGSCVVVEDAPAGIAAAHAAGMRVIGITTTFERERLDCHWCVDDFESWKITSCR